MSRYFVRLAFVGSRFHGWQIQENADSVQQHLNQAFSVVLREDIQITGCGRTDTGVHAKDYFAHYDFSGRHSLKEIQDLIYKLNRFLPQDIVIKDIMSVTPDAHARFSALSRTYEYYISREKDPFSEGFSYYIFGKLDIDLMNKGADLLMTFTDFSSFAKSGTKVKTNLCHLNYARWEQNGDQLVLRINANRFLRNMVRAIVGTLIDLGRGTINLNMMQEIIEQKSRSAAGFSVPACGLFLTQIEYPQDIFLPADHEQ